MRKFKAVYLSVCCINQANIDFITVCFFLFKRKGILNGINSNHLCYVGGCEFVTCVVGMNKAS